MTRAPRFSQDRGHHLAPLVAASTTRTRSPSSDGIRPSLRLRARRAGAGDGRASPGRRVLMGRRSVKTAPGRGSRFATVIVPWCSSTRWRAMARPRPSPPFPRVAAPPACRNRSKTWGRKSGGIRGPCPPPSPRLAHPPLGRARPLCRRPGVNLMELDRRFHRTCCRRLGLPSRARPPRPRSR